MIKIPILKKRITGRLSKDMTEDQIREAISKMAGIPVNKLPSIQFNNELARIESEIQSVKEITAAYKTKLDSLPQKNKYRYDELNDIGKFIYFANKAYPAENNFVLVVPEEIEKYPDFTLLYGNKKIGVEHTRLMYQDGKALIVAINNYLEKTEKILTKELGHLSKTVNIFFDYNKTVIGKGNFCDRNFTNEEKMLIPQIIADYIKTELIGGKVTKPEFIDRITITPNMDSRVDIVLGENYLTRFNFSGLLQNCIQKKELKADEYRAAVSVNKLWLLIVIDDINSFSGFNLDSPAIPKIQSSKFDSILMFEKFSGGIYVLFNKVLAS